MTKEEAREAARLGAEHLDRELGGEWRTKIDLDHLDMSMGIFTSATPGNECGCVLAQLYGTYTHGVERLTVDEDAEEDVEFGFVPPESDWQVGVGYGDAWTLLTEAWKEEIAR